jgi:hypothetical protein
MAIDPNLSDDQKRRLRRASTFAASGAGATGGLLPDARGDTPFTLQPEEGYRPTDRQRALARAGVLAAEAENARGAFVDAEERAIDERQRALHNRGARRLFRGVDAQGNTVYTDRPGDPLMAGPGEERFYGADGWRLDEGLTNPGRAADIQPGRGRAQAVTRPLSMTSSTPVTTSSWRPSAAVSRGSKSRLRATGRPRSPSRSRACSAWATARTPSPGRPARAKAWTWAT